MLSASVLPTFDINILELIAVIVVPWNLISTEVLVLVLLSNLLVLTPCYQPIQDEFFFIIKVPL